MFLEIWPAIKPTLDIAWSYQKYFLYFYQVLVLLTQLQIEQLENLALSMQYNANLGPECFLHFTFNQDFLYFRR